MERANGWVNKQCAILTLGRRVERKIRERNCQRARKRRKGEERKDGLEKRKHNERRKGQMQTVDARGSRKSGRCLYTHDGT